MAQAQHKTVKGKKVKSANNNTDAALMDMLETVRALKSVVEKETDVLERTDISAFLNLQDEKLEIARIYNDKMASLMAKKDQIKLAKPALKAALEQSQKEFQNITHKNRDQLERMARTTKRLSDKIMSVARNHAARENQIAYGNTGAIEGRKKASIGVNESA